jgi:hypothetical protein
MMGGRGLPVIFKSGYLSLNKAQTLSTYRFLLACLLACLLA